MGVDTKSRQEKEKGERNDQEESKKKKTPKKGENKEEEKEVPVVVVTQCTPEGPPAGCLQGGARSRGQPELNVCLFFEAQE